MAWKLRLRHSASRAWAAIEGEVGLQEVLLVVSLTMATYALWPVAGRVSLLLPALTVLWIVLPQRTTLIVQPPQHRNGDKT